MALIANCHRNPEARRTPYQPRDFANFLPKPERKAPTETLSIDALQLFLDPADRDGEVLKIH